MRFEILAVDYDGTIASHGAVGEATLTVLEAVAGTGRRLALITGRIVEELLEIFPGIRVFDLVVAENGGVLYRPATGEQRLLGEAVPARMVQALRARGVIPLSVGRVVCATLDHHEEVVVRTIHELHLDHQIIFNKHSVMILPANVNKASGLRAVLDELGVGARAAVAVGDGENDMAMLAMAGCGVAVANALDSVKERAQIVTPGAAGEGVRQLGLALIADDLESMLEAQRRTTG